jgi:hypothetical protein
MNDSATSYIEQRTERRGGRWVWLAAASIHVIVIRAIDADSPHTR